MYRVFKNLLHKTIYCKGIIWIYIFIWTGIKKRIFEYKTKQFIIL